MFAQDRLARVGRRIAHHAAAVCSRFDAFGRDRGGNIVLLFALTVPVVLTASAIALDYSSTAADRTRIQALADGAAIAAVIDVQNSSGLSVGQAKKKGQDTASAWVMANAGRTNISSITTTVTDQLNQVTVQVQATEVAHLYNFAGQSSYAYSAKASAVADSTAPICLLALDKTQSPGILFKGSGSFTGKSCVIWSNSTSLTQSIYFSGSAKVVADTICAGGRVGYQGSAKATPTPTENCATFQDPLAKWSPGAVSTACTYTNISRSTSSATLDPGVYCGNTNVSSTDVTLNPGIYVINDGNFKVKGNAGVTGTNVLFLLTGNASISFTAGSDLQLSGRTDAQGNQVLIAEYGTVSANTATFSGSTTLQLAGTIHLPSQEVDVSSNATLVMSTPASSIIARNIVVDGSGAIQYPASTTGTAPQWLGGVSKVRLVQ